MPDRGGRQALHRLCDSVSGANWRPTRFEDEFTLSRYACCACHVIPSTTVLLPCSHALCEQCLAGCVIQDGGSVCPMDAEPFCEDECQWLKLPARKEQNLKAHCWNEADGCQFVGTIEAVLLHYDRECTFHAVQCPNCEQRLLRTDIAAHYASGCCQNASCARNAQSNREISLPASFETNVVLDKFSTLERKINEVLEICGASNSARSQGISHAVGAFENTLQRIMEGIEENISTMITRQLTASLQELKAATTVLCSDHLASLQSQMNELVEQSRQRDASQMQEIGSVLKDSQMEVKEEVKIKVQEMVSLLRASESDVKENVKTQLEEFVQVMRNCVGVLKEHVSKVEDTLSSRLTDQQQSLQAVFDSLNKNKESIEREKSLPAATMAKQETLWHFKLDFLLSQALERLELLRQQIYRQNEEPWVSKSEYDFHDSFIMGTKDFECSSFDVTLENYEKIYDSDRVPYITVNRYYRDVCINITFYRDTLNRRCLCVNVECLRTLGNSEFPFDEIFANVVKSNGGGLVPLMSYNKHACTGCSNKAISHFHIRFCTFQYNLDEDGLTEHGKLTLRFDFK
ncbi:uncharacterized protein LOC119164957 [Rhipicephalus microplus]|uniref:uncharacterized protein LOC119164957 n=1 Tax=Rhipicephalus microplus TaxID=6941 RepID=UPI003F6C6B99